MGKIIYFNEAVKEIRPHQREETSVEKIVRLIRLEIRKTVTPESPVFPHNFIKAN